MAMVFENIPVGFLKGFFFVGGEFAGKAAKEKGARKGSWYNRDKCSHHNNVGTETYCTYEMLWGYIGGMIDNFSA